MWLATSMPPIITIPCFDFRGVPPGDLCTFVDFRRELLPIFNASTIEVGVADARADEQRRAGIGPDGERTCLQRVRMVLLRNRVDQHDTSTLIQTAGLQKSGATQSPGYVAAAFLMKH